MADFTKEFQTPPEVCRYMASLVPPCSTILEPTPGIGNIVKALSELPFCPTICAPEDFFNLHKHLKFDAVVMNPPFSSKSAILDNAPKSYKEDKGMKFGYRMLTDCMQKSNVIIALMPWFTISDSDVRLRYLKAFGLKSITALPRKTFEYARIQTCVLELVKDWNQETIFHVFDFLEEIPSARHKQQVKLDLDVDVKKVHKILQLF